MRSWHVLCVTIAAGCGRVGFDAAADAPVTDVATDANAVTVLADIAFPYSETDWFDGGMDIDNRPLAISWVDAPFQPGFVVSTGRMLYEIALDGTYVMHDLEPALPDMTGPDSLDSFAFGMGRLWIGSASWDIGDGLFWLDASWVPTRETGDNNVEGVAFDETGTFDGIGAARVYFQSGNAGVLRRDDASTFVPITTTPFDAGTLGFYGDNLFVVVNEPAGFTLYRVEPGTHALTMLDQLNWIGLAAGASGDGLVAARGMYSVVRYQADGSFVELARDTDPDPDWNWRMVTIPGPPHPLAGRSVVLSSNTVQGRFRVLLLPP